MKSSTRPSGVERSGEATNTATYTVDGSGGGGVQEAQASAAAAASSSASSAHLLAYMLRGAPGGAKGCAHDGMAR